jgi:hypothetical protein
MFVKMFPPFFTARANKEHQNDKIQYGSFSVAQDQMKHVYHTNHRTKKFSACHFKSKEAVTIQHS